MNMMPMHNGCFNFSRRRIDLFQYIKMSPSDTVRVAVNVLPRVLYPPPTPHPPPPPNQYAISLIYFSFRELVTSIRRSLRLARTNYL